MSYIFSQALVAASLPASCLGIEPSAPLSGSLTPKPCLWHDKTMEPSRLSRFGMTCKTLTDDHGVALLTSWQAGFRAKTSAPPEKEQDLTAQEAECGTTWPASLAKLDPVTSLWKTHQRSLLEGLEEYSQTWPRWGLMRSGECWERATLAPRISESASGLWQTPVADDSVSRVNGKWKSRGEPKLSAQVMYPTPLANSHTGSGHGPNKTGSPNLQTVVMCSTPCALDAKPITGGSLYRTQTGTVRHMRQDGKSSNRGLSAQVAFPTPVSTMHKGWSPNHNQADTDDRLDYTIEREGFTPGQTTPPTRLNPDWVEWLMGWPIGHTDLKPLETGKYQEWRQQHSIY